jgi:hypothetical protein
MALTDRGTHCVGRAGRKGWRSHSLDQSSEHASYLMQCPVQGLILFLGQKAEIACQQEKVFQLAGGTGSDVQKLTKLRPSGASASFRDIRGHRKRRSPHLAGQPKSFMLRKCKRRTINAQYQRMTLLPDFQLFEILHATSSKTSPWIRLSAVHNSSRNSGFNPNFISKHLFFCVYLQLITNNCQLIRGRPC